MITPAVSVVWPWFFYECKALIPGIISNTQNMVIACIEKFLDVIKVWFRQSKMRGSDQLVKSCKWLGILNMERKRMISPQDVFCNIIWLVCHTVTIFLRTQRTMLIGPLRYLQRVRKAYRNFSGGTWKNVSAQNMKFCQNILTWTWASFFKISPFFAFPDM